MHFSWKSKASHFLKDKHTLSRVGVSGMGAARKQNRQAFTTKNLERMRLGERR
ncbi:MAG: hypothetical protein ACLP3B_22515 [Syntrophobacteraceae bacterium]